MLILLLWVSITVSIWIVVISGLRRQIQDKRRIPLDLTATVIAFGAVPPSIICLISTFVLLQAAPTVQFNAGSSYAMDLWSFWADAWRPLVSATELLAVAYFVWTVAGFVFKRHYWANYAILCAFLSASLGWLILRMSFPSV
jgi:hypothetical protein